MVSDQLSREFSPSQSTTRINTVALPVSATCEDLHRWRDLNTEQFHQDALGRLHQRIQTERPTHHRSHVDRHSRDDIEPPPKPPQ